MEDEGRQYFRRWSPGGETTGTEEERWPRQFAETHLHMSQALGYALELRDPAMRIAGHCARVAALACRMAKSVGVSGVEMEALRHAAELHEIGLVAVPGELLHRPGPLSHTELERVRAQAWVGAEVVRAMYSQLTSCLIEHQYEDYDALRRNNRLGERELLLVGILRVADVLDAVTVPRPYQPPLSLEARVELLRGGSATRYHPLAVEAALRLQKSEGGPPNSVDPPPGTLRGDTTPPPCTPPGISV